MPVYIAGFICALVLAVLVLAWIAYCMFVRERHKSELFQYSISDLQHRNYLMSQEPDTLPKEEKELTVGYFVLPSRKNKEEDYNKRPDYPEGPTPVSQTSTDKLIEILNEDESLYKDGIYEVDSKAMYHSQRSTKATNEEI